MTEDVSRLGIRNVGWIVEVRFDFARGNFEISKWDFKQVSILFQQNFSAVFQWIYRWLNLAPSPNVAVCKMQRFGKCLHF